uniref:hypothetical protein n=1 Tax=Microseira wollei TaxID=467598 RepID=UPI001CFE989B|nr:hypothetical protein [Microseira wollei]
MTNNMDSTGVSFHSIVKGELSKAFLQGFQPKARSLNDRSTPKASRNKQPTNPHIVLNVQHNLNQAFNALLKGSQIRQGD